MFQSNRVLIATMVLSVLFTTDAHGQRLLEIDGVELRGESLLVMPGGGTCNVLESDTSFEARQANDGASMDIWRLDFRVRNGSGRWLDHVMARYQVESEWPECTNWDRDRSAELPNVEWTDTADFIQRSGRNVVAPGETLTATKYFIVLQGDPAPRFTDWSVDFDFAVNPPEAGTAPAAAAGAQQPATAATAEQENLFWQSIADSDNPAMFEAYLEQFPNGVFRALAEARLTELRASSENRSGRPSAGDTTAQALPRLAPMCTEASRGSDGDSCWMELSSHPGCYVWNPNPQPNETVTWTGQCAQGMAQGFGTTTWRYDGGESVWTGRMVDGKMEGEWTYQDALYCFRNGELVPCQ